MKFYIALVVLIGCACAQSPKILPASASPSEDTEIVKVVHTVFDLLQTILKVLKGTVSAIPILRNEYLPIMQLLDPSLPNILDAVEPELETLVSTGLVGDLLGKPNLQLLNHTLSMVFEELLSSVPADQKEMVLKALETPFESLSQGVVGQLIKALQGVVQHILKLVNELLVPINQLLGGLLDPVLG